MSECGAALRIVSRDLSLSQISAILGHEQSQSSYDKGTIRKRMQLQMISGKPGLVETKAEVCNHTSWTSESVDGDAKGLNAILKELLGYPVIEALKSKRSEFGAITAEANVAIYLEEEHHHTRIEASIVKRLAEVGLGIALHCYVCAEEDEDRPADSHVKE